VTLKAPGNAATTVKAHLRDVSISGLGLRLDRGTRLPASRLVLQAVDSYGNRHALPIRVLRTSEGPRYRTLGCCFEGDEAVRRQVIGFVYGDSGRWKYFAEERRVDGISTLRAFFKLLGIGLKGMWRHAAGLLRVGWSRVVRSAGSA